MIDKMELKKEKKSKKKTEKEIDATISENFSSFVEIKSVEKESEIAEIQEIDQKSIIPPPIYKEEFKDLS